MRRRLSAEEVTQGLRCLAGWSLLDGTHIVKRYEFRDFVGALLFVNRVGERAQEQDHHPDVCLGYGYAEVSITTHSAGGVTALDLQLASSCEAAFRA